MLGVLITFILVHLILWAGYELFFKFYWYIICYGIENKLIDEDVFTVIEKLRNITKIIW